MHAGVSGSSGLLDSLGLDSFGLGSFGLGSHSSLELEGGTGSCLGLSFKNIDSIPLPYCVHFLGLRVLKK